MHANRIIGLDSVELMYPKSFIRRAPSSSTSESFSAPPRMPIQQVPHDAVRHCTGIGPSWHRPVAVRVAPPVVGRCRREMLRVDRNEAAVFAAFVESDAVTGLIRTTKTAHHSLAVVFPSCGDDLVRRFPCQRLRRVSLARCLSERLEPDLHKFPPTDSVQG